MSVYMHVVLVPAQTKQRAGMQCFAQCIGLAQRIASLRAVFSGTRRTGKHLPALSAAL